MKVKSLRVLAWNWEFAAFLIAVFPIASSVSGAEYFSSNTVESPPDSLVLNGVAPDYESSLTYVEVGVYLHILRESGGSGGLTESEVDTLVSGAAADMEGLSVYLVEVGRDEVNNSTYYGDPDSCAAALFAVNPHSDAIDIYLGPDSGTPEGRASGIPGSALVLTGELDSHAALTHLLGNCLGLYDTDNTSFGAENPDGSDGETKGDLIADTPADPGLAGYFQSSCVTDAGFESAYPAYSPYVDNFMSNGPTGCWSNFTAGQKARVMAALENFELLNDVVIATVPNAAYVDRTGITTLNSFTTYPEDRSGAAAFDFFGTADKDIIIVGHTNVLDGVNLGCAGEYHSTDLATGTPIFDDITGEVFGSRPRNGSAGVVVADYDNDGDLDFYVPNPGYDGVGYPEYPHRFYRNDCGEFTNATSDVFDQTEAAVSTMTGAWGDYDRDGFLDLLVGVAHSAVGITAPGSAASLKLYHNVQDPQGGPGDRIFEPITTGLGIDLSDDDDVISVMWIDMDQDADVDLVTIVAAQDETAKSHFYENLGGTFQSADSRFAERDSLHYGNTIASPGDFDNDGDIDILFYGAIIRGYFENSINPTTGEASLALGWFEQQPVNVQWETQATDLDVFDHNLDGWLDFGFSNTYSTLWWHRVFENRPSQVGFDEYKLPKGQTYGRNMTAADWTMDGFTELFVSNYSSGDRDTVSYYRSASATDPSYANHWIGIRLATFNPAACDSVEIQPCNWRGIGATVVVSAGSFSQAQIVDGGSGRYGQHDLDLSFGLGSYVSAGDSADVKVIWPCGQVQYERLPVDTYHTIPLGWPVVDQSTVSAWMSWNPIPVDGNWEFQWETSSPSNPQDDWIEFPSGVSFGGGVLYSIDSSRSDVDLPVITKTGDGTYKHVLTWAHIPCTGPVTVPFKAHSGAVGDDFTHPTTKNLVIKGVFRVSCG